MGGTLIDTYPLTNYVSGWAEANEHMPEVPIVGVIGCILPFVATIILFGYALSYDDGEHWQAQRNLTIGGTVAFALAVIAPVILMSTLEYPDTSGIPSLRQTVEKESGMQLISCDGDSGEKLLEDRYSYGHLPEEGTILHCTAFTDDNTHIQDVYMVLPVDGDQFAVYRPNN